VSVLIVWMISRLPYTGSLPIAWHHAPYPHTFRPIDPPSSHNIFTMKMAVAFHTETLGQLG